MKNNHHVMHMTALHIVIPDSVPRVGEGTLIAYLSKAGKGFQMPFLQGVRLASDAYAI